LDDKAGLSVRLPPDRAFLVRLDADADPTHGLLFGRVEHLASGERADFTSPEELEGFIKKMVTEESCVEQEKR
jgi:hypothetical protein